MYFYCLDRHSPPEQRTAISDAIGRGLVTEVNLRVRETYEDEWEATFKFENL